MQCSVDLATQLQVQRSDSSKHSPAVAKLALHLPFLDVQLVNNLSRVGSHARAKGFRGQGQLVTSTSQPATKGQSATFGVTTSNDFHTRSNDDQKRVPHSFRRGSRSFQIRNPRSRSPEDKRPTCSASTATRNRRKGLNGAPPSCLPCICSVSCALLGG